MLQSFHFFFFVFYDFFLPLPLLLLLLQLLPRHGHRNLWVEDVFVPLHLVWFGYLHELCVYTQFIFKCLTDGGWRMVAYPFRHVLYCTGCWQYLLSTKWLLYGMLFLHFTVSLGCFCPRTLILKKQIGQVAMDLIYISYVITEGKSSRVIMLLILFAVFGPRMIIFLLCGGPFLGLYFQTSVGVYMWYGGEEVSFDQHQHDDDDDYHHHHHNSNNNNTNTINTTTNINTDTTNTNSNTPYNDLSPMLTYCQ